MAIESPSRTAQRPLNVVLRPDVATAVGHFTEGLFLGGRVCPRNARPAALV